MKKLFILIIIIFTLNSINAQHQRIIFPQQQIDAFNKTALQKICSGDTAIMRSNGKSTQTSGLSQILKLQRSIKKPIINSLPHLKNTDAYDTLIIVDTLNITGTYTHNGPIIVINGGFLHFSNATATILGDIIVWGPNSRLYADSSYLYIPQQYFYQRSLLVIGGSIVHYHNTILDHSGLSNNLLVANNSYVEMLNVQNNGFTTNSVMNKAQLYINGTNEAGEYVITDSVQLNFKNASTILLWHQFPATSVVNFAFPNGDTVVNYKFNKTLAGVQGVNYNINVDTSINVMWGMMPVTGSNVTISNSKIRSIGLWFTGSDTIAVNGLVNNSHYGNFTASLSDRNLQLTNCDVQTWSIYPMGKTHVNLSACIVGEVGTEQSSNFMGTNFTCDGSSGYMWATDTSIVIAGYSSAVNAVRSQGNGIVLFAYCSLMGGYPSALNSSIIMVIQSSVQQEPQPLDNSCAWYAMIDQPFNTFVDTNAVISGSSWIVKTASSQLMDFHSYRMYYQKNNATNWTEILCDSLHAKHNDTLAVWNTNGLVAGQYNVKMVLTDNWGNSAEAIKAVNLMPKILAGIVEQKTDVIKYYPNPVKEELTIETNFNKEQKFEILNLIGQTVYTSNIKKEASINTSTFPGGLYFIKLYMEDKTLIKKFVKQ